MLYIALKRLWNRIGLTLLSIVAVMLALGIAIGIPVFAKAVSFVVLRQELDAVSAASGRPAFSLRAYVLPGTQYALPVQQAKQWEQHIVETLVSEVGLPVANSQVHLETLGLTLRTRAEDTIYGEPHLALLTDTSLVVMPGIQSSLETVAGRAMQDQQVDSQDLQVWLHASTALSLGLSPGEKYELWGSGLQTAIPVQIAGTWRAADPGDTAWFQNPDLTLQGKLLVRADDYRVMVEPILQQRLGFASWYLTFDDRRLTSENMKRHADGLARGQQIVAQYVPGVRFDGSPLRALERSLQREAQLTVLMLACSAPVLGFLLYFVSLISSITLRWQQRETAVMVSRGMHRGQLLAVGAIEALILTAVGFPLGVWAGLGIAQAMGYTESFMRFTWREPIAVSPTAANAPLALAVLAALFVARLLPVARSASLSIVTHERRRARAPSRPFWQRFYLDIALVGPVAYAYYRLRVEGTLVPQADVETGVSIQDPLLFLVPALFVLATSLLLARLFPLSMRIGDWLSALGRRPTPYLAFRQLARQSGQYTGALLLVVISLGLGGFAASMAGSLDNWLVDQVYYQIGSDVLIRQMLDPQYVEAGLIPPDGPWMLPVETYLSLPGVTAAARVGMYDASYHEQAGRNIQAVFLGVDRLDLPQVLYFRPDFARQPLGGLMNQLATQANGVLVSEGFMQEHHLQVDDAIQLRVVLVDVGANEISLSDRFTVVGSYRYFPTVYEKGNGDVVFVGNLEYLFQQAGGPEIHNIWLRTEPDADQRELARQVSDLGVRIKMWGDVRRAVSVEQARAERVGTLGTLTIGFLAAAAFSGIGLLIYNYASLQERLFRFTILRAVGLSLGQIVAQVVLEYVVLMAYGIVGGALVGASASQLFIPFFQAADQNVLRPPTMIPFVAWAEIARISGVFLIALVVAQTSVIGAALRRGVFQALRIGDSE
ncbi:MAG: FtsX-like permease family protein [Anaerolineae bacterium]